jgi:ubiquinone/menaquinone biosynthesis C-methylase UbiE
LDENLNKHRSLLRAYDEESRRKWQNPEAILEEIGLRPDATFIDLGCGEGFFALPAARLVGARGIVYGLDASSEAIERLRERAVHEGIANLRLIVGRAEDTVLCEACADFVFFGTVLHDFEEPAKVLTNAAKMLKAGGRLVALDWKKEPMKFGPPLAIRFSEGEATKLIKAGGFRIQTVRKSGPYHYLVIAHRQFLVES